eukprot:GHVQ01000649.1.p1 GENE.GHVQ01000649.1~~GHVQ01000649.1.p1  ORF type:complete len:129 (-),score=17.97 GHVQ01000649.1:755-1141(-)
MADDKTELNPQFDELGKQFAQQYFSNFSSNRPAIVGMFGQHSMLTWEGQQFQGLQGIQEKLLALPRATYQVSSFDCQPVYDNGILVTVSGDVTIEENPPMKFMQVFVLRRAPAGSYYIFNTIFRLVLD